MPYNISKLGNKSIRMPAELADKWLAALRGGEYQQATGALCNGYGFCCLGVLQHVIDGECEHDTHGRDGKKRYKGIPTMEWLTAKNIEFMSPLTTDNDCNNPVIGFDVHDDSYVTAAEMNDVYGGDFTEIADYLESCVEKV